MHTALVLGNSKGIGHAISRRLRMHDIFVPIISRSSGYDLMLKEGRDELFKEFPAVDILIGNVGGMGTCGLMDFEEVMKKNYFINVEILLHYLPEMITKRFGRVVFISSIFGKEKGQNPVFAAAKAAQIAFIKSMAGKYKGITFNTVCPGYIDVGKIYEGLPRMGQPEDVAEVVEFLCTSETHHINGSCITIDGGDSNAF